MRCETHERDVRETATVRRDNADACAADRFTVSQVTPDRLPTLCLAHHAMIVVAYSAACIKILLTASKS
eukprot:9056554-Pyramimonas_sp.AAC.2